MRVDDESITIENVREVKAKLCARLAAGETLFDLSGVKRVDSAALSLVLALGRAAEARGARVAFANPPEQLRALGDLYGLEALGLFEGAKEGD